MSDAETTADLFAGLAEVLVRRGRFVGLDSVGSALVDLGNSRFPCDFGAGYIPVVNEPVEVLSIGARHLMFPLGAQPRVGTVQTVTSPRCTVATAAGVITAIISGANPVSGDRVLIHWTEDGPVTGPKLATTPPAPVPPPNPGGGGTVKTATFYAIDAGSTDRGAPRWWTGNPRAGNTTYGAWFYGTQIKDTIAAAATFVSLEFFVNRTQDSGGAPRFALHNAGVKGGIPGFAAYTEWDPAYGWQVPPDPAGWFAALKAGGAYAGVGLNQGGNNIFASLAQDRASGALRISWR